MNRKKYSLSEALLLAASLPYAYLRTTEAVTLGVNPGAQLSDDLVEARWFSESEEIRVFDCGCGWEAVRTVFTDGAECITRDYQPDQPGRMGSRLTVRQYLEADEDGQYAVAAVCLAGWKGVE